MFVFPILSLRPKFHLLDTPFWLCDLEQVPSLLGCLNSSSSSDVLKPIEIRYKPQVSF